MWLCPCFSKLDAVVEKIFIDNAEGIILIPVWKHQTWFGKLAKIAITWWDIPIDQPVLQTPSGAVIPPRKNMSFRAVYFNASNSDLSEIIPMRWMEVENVMNIKPIRCLSTMVDPNVYPHGLVHPHGTPSIPEIDLTYPHDPQEHDHGQLRGVIASASQHEKASHLVERVMTLYHEQLHEPKLAREVDPDLRGPHGVATIDLIDGARPMARKPFRMPGERESALKIIVDKYISRGWIRPSKSEWAAQAFVVPKPTSPDGTKQWKMVVDYRYLNTQTRDDPFPLPLIENLIGRQADNRLWSIFDLEDGFHQMHLDVDHWHLTAFVTP